MLFAAQRYSDHFARPYLKHLDCEVLITGDVDEIRRAAVHHDVVWIEWANRQAAELLREPLPAFTIVRVHDYEVRTGIVRNVNWDNVDLIWFINRQTAHDFRHRVRTPVPSFYLPNAVDVDQFKEHLARSTRLAALSVRMQQRKGYPRMVELMSLLPEEYTLAIRATPDDDYKRCLQLIDRFGLGGRVRFESRPFSIGRINDKRDVNAFFRDKSHVLSTSRHEGFHYSVAEGMCCGCAPAVFSWEWGRPEDFWGPFVSYTLEQMADRIQSSGPNYMWRRYVAANFGADILSAQLMGIIEEQRSKKAA